MCEFKSIKKRAAGEQQSRAISIPRGGIITLQRSDATEYFGIEIKIITSII